MEKFEKGEWVVYLPMGWCGEVESAKKLKWSTIFPPHMRTYIYKVKLDQEHELPFIWASEHLLARSDDGNDRNQ